MLRLQRAGFITAVVFSVVILMAGLGCNRAQKASEAPQPVAQPAATPPPQPVASPAAPKAESRHLAPGVIKVEMLEVVDSEVPVTTNFIPAVIAEDVMGADSRLAVPAGAKALLLPLRLGKFNGVAQIGLSLYCVFIDGHQYNLAGGDRNPATALIAVDTKRDQTNKSAHISEHSVIDFTLRKPAELR